MEEYNYFANFMYKFGGPYTEPNNTLKASQLMFLAKIVTETRTWLGTPYHHQQSIKGAGCDCLGLVRGVYKNIMGVAPEQPPNYSRDWAEASGDETLIKAAGRHMLTIPIQERGAGDVVIFRMRKNSVAKHAGILTGTNSMIHAVEGAVVSEVTLNRWWQRRIAAVFRFPET